jgi:hypothetical protein
MTDVNVGRQFLSHKLEPGSIGALLGCHCDSTIINLNVTLAKSEIVGMNHDETISRRVSIRINQGYTGQA